MIYHQTMTPSWLTGHASYIDSHHTWSTEQLTFNVSTIHHAALLKHSAPLTAKIVGSHDVNICKKEDSDISYGLSDEMSFVVFTLEDNLQYNIYAPCFGREGGSGVSLTGGKDLSHQMPKPSDSFYPGQFAITLKLDERWGSCHIAHDGGFVKTAVYSKRLVLDKGLTLEVYKGDNDERVGIKFIEVTVLTRRILLNGVGYL